MSGRDDVSSVTIPSDTGLLNIYCLNLPRFTVPDEKSPFQMAKGVEIESEARGMIEVYVVTPLYVDSVMMAPSTAVNPPNVCPFFAMQ